MTTAVLLVGRRPEVIEEAIDALQSPDLELLGATTLAEVQDALARNRIDQLISGAGLDLDTRLSIVREALTRSSRTSIHLKDSATGPQGFIPFARAVLRNGLVPHARE